MLTGMENTTDSVSYVQPEIDDTSIIISGVYDNFTVQWKLISPIPLPAVDVKYNISIVEVNGGSVLYQSVSH